MNKQYKWIIHHAYSSGAWKKGGLLRYWMDRLDLHPRTTIKLLRANAYSFVTKKKIPVFIHIPKTGGTYVNSCFPSNGFVSLGHALLRESLGDDHVPVGLIGTRFRPLKRHVLFSTVRNPLTFFRSYYHHVIGHGKWYNSNHYDYQAAQRGFEYLMQTIMDREDKWPSQKFLFPQLFNQSGQLVVSWINKNEMLDEDMALFAKSLGYRFKKGEKKRAAPVREMAEYYSDALQQQVHEVYKREFALFGYDKDSCMDNNSVPLHRDVASHVLTYDYEKDDLKYGSY